MTEETAGKQTYNEMTIYVCRGCGSIVLNQVQHDYWHYKTRSVV